MDAVRRWWWLNPWREVRRQAACYESRIDDLCETAQMDFATIRQLETELDATRAKLRNALLGNLHTATNAQQPEFVLVGIDRGPGLGKRLIAGPPGAGAELGMTSMDDPPPRWKITATLARPLFIDRPDYAAALEHMRTIWQNWDAEQPTTVAAPIDPPARGAIEP